MFGEGIARSRMNQGLAFLAEGRNILASGREHLDAEDFKSFLAQLEGLTGIGNDLGQTLNTAITANPGLELLKKKMTLVPDSQEFQGRCEKLKAQMRSAALKSVIEEGRDDGFERLSLDNGEEGEC